VKSFLEQLQIWVPINLLVLQKLAGVKLNDWNETSELADKPFILS
jgi:hypothetical protein